MKYLWSLCLSLAFLGCTNYSSSSENQKGTIITDSIWSEHLQKFKIIRVYLPPGYSDNPMRYAALYLHDGQNLFYDSTSYVGEWGIDESLDSLYQSEGISLIAIGIDHGGEDRISEYSMYDSKYGSAKGTEYLNFLVQELKPKIDSLYRTKPGPSSTLILGSSLGGLISHYAFFQNPDVFGRVGIFSPSYWFDTLSLNLADPTILSASTRIYLYGGAEEGSRMTELIQVFENEITSDSTKSVQLKVSINPSGLHKEQFWREEFPKAITWLMKNE